MARSPRPFGSPVPSLEFPDTFDQLNSVMELRDGRLLATDFAGPTVQLVDFARGTRTHAWPEGRRTQPVHDARPPAFLRG